uniref:Uncharacterized protein n=1 Tax=Arundo donax TaxID=35708 RepID=A0A0A9HAN8_ARUDO
MQVMLVRGGQQSAGGDRVRRLDGRHRQQQLHPDPVQGQRPSVRTGPRRRGRHRLVLQWPPRGRLRLRGARPAGRRPGVSLPRPQHPPAHVGCELRLGGQRPG